MHLRFLLSLLFTPILIPGYLLSQASIRETTETIPTYPYSDPNRVPMLVNRPDLYPYHRFEGYSNVSEPRPWKVVHLENDYIEVWVLPEVGGKVWGAREKKTGNTFIYRNEVMKFRNIAMRGPWTSGGIEFNFGIIGHHPGAASPVDYLVRKSEDGSVSCFVGAMDLPSRSSWRVEIRLPADKAYFETRATWYNDHPLHESYYNWMTAAAEARNDLEFFTPGDLYLDHPGDPHPWPVDAEGRNLARYDQNAFGPSKSYHVVGAYDNFFGGYYHDLGYGFGHWARYDEMPGQKLWLWSQARSGAIWEDLLTDANGQYIEFQAGRLFNQYSASPRRNSISDVAFPPHSTDTWRERWFPVGEIGGISAASPQAVLHAVQEAGQLELKLFGLAEARGILRVVAGKDTLFQRTVEIAPTETLSIRIPVPAGTDYIVSIPEWDLAYYSDPRERELERPFAAQLPQNSNEADRLYRAGLESMDRRDYAEAREKLEAALELTPQHREALAATAELAFRRADFGEAKNRALAALRLDTYHPYANYMAGLAFRANGDYFDAMDALGWAARSPAFRSAAYAEMADLMLSQSSWREAGHYAAASLKSNDQNVAALQAGAISARKQNQTEEARIFLGKLESLDPLHHFVRAEKYLEEPNKENARALQDLIRQEMGYQIYLELAIGYVNRGLAKDALAILDLAPRQGVVILWKAYLRRDSDPAKAVQGLRDLTETSPDFVFPYRRESLAALRWAHETLEHWKIRYYLALNLWGTGSSEEAGSLLASCGNEPDYATFYLARAALSSQQLGASQEEDVRRAWELDPGDWRTWSALIEAVDPEEALALADLARERFAGNPNIDMAYVRTLQENGDYAGSLRALDQMNILPFEGASEGHRLYRRANIALAMESYAEKDYRSAAAYLDAAKAWPENLGVGKPYRPDETLENYLLYHANSRLGDTERAARSRGEVIDFARQHMDRRDLSWILALRLMPEEDALARIEAWKAAGDLPASTRWVIARYLGNDDEADLLAWQGQKEDWLSGQDTELLLMALEQAETER